MPRSKIDSWLMQQAGKEPEEAANLAGSSNKPLMIQYKNRTGFPASGYAHLIDALQSMGDFANGNQWILPNAMGMSSEEFPQDAVELDYHNTLRVRMTDSVTNQTTTPGVIRVYRDFKSASFLYIPVPGVN